jgi:hypothetical protein
MTVTARAGSFTGVTQVAFTRADPDTVFVQAAKSTVPLTDGSVEIAAFLIRASGQVTTNTVVTYNASDSTGARIGTLLSPTLATPDPDDKSPSPRLKSTVTVDPDATAVPGPATITASAGGKTASTTILITPPPEEESLVRRQRF